MPRRSQQRARGEGSVYRDGAGWRWAISLEDGTRARGRATTRDLAAAAMRKAQRAVDDGEGVPKKASALTVSDWVTTVVETIRIRPRTREDYESTQRRLIDPYIGSVKLAKLTPEQIDRWMVRLEADGKGQPSQRAAFALLRRCYTLALRRDMVKTNPCERTDGPKLQRRAPSHFSPEEARAILDAAVKRRNGARWAIALALGLRQGEALGLHDAAVRLDARPPTLRVDQALQRQKWKHGCIDACGLTPRRCPSRRGGGLVLVEPKSTAGVRTLAIPAPLVPVLREHLRSRAKEQLRAGSEWRPSSLLFVHDDGRPVSPEDDWDDWGELLKESGVAVRRDGKWISGYRRPYDTRHTALTFMAAAGVPPRVAMEIAGHSQITLTQHIYTHVMDESRIAAAEAIGGVLWEQKTGAGEARTPGSQRGQAGTNI